MSGFSSIFNLDVCAVGHGDYTMSFNFFTRVLPNADTPYDATPNANDTIAHCSYRAPGPSPAAFYNAPALAHFNCTSDGSVPPYQVSLNGFYTDPTPDGSIGIFSIAGSSAGALGSLFQIPVSGFNQQGLYIGSTNFTTYAVIT